jgi:hypothetical protein
MKDEMIARGSRKMTVQAWPRFLPDPTAETMTHALLIEAYAIVVRLSASDEDLLMEAHSNAERYARAHYSDETIRSAWAACGNANQTDVTLLCPLTMTRPRSHEIPMS